MRKSPVALAIRHALGVSGKFVYHYGPISPYTTEFNRNIYYRMLGAELMTGRSVGKTTFIKDLMYAEHYSPKVRTTP